MSLFVIPSAPLVRSLRLSSRHSCYICLLLDRCQEGICFSVEKRSCTDRSWLETREHSTWQECHPNIGDKKISNFFYHHIALFIYYSYYYHLLLLLFITLCIIALFLLLRSYCSFYLLLLLLLFICSLYYCSFYITTVIFLFLFYYIALFL